MAASGTARGKPKTSHIRHLVYAFPQVSLLVSLTGASESNWYLHQLCSAVEIRTGESPRPPHAPATDLVRRGLPNRVYVYGQGTLVHTTCFVGMQWL